MRRCAVSLSLVWLRSHRPTLCALSPSDVDLLQLQNLRQVPETSVPADRYHVDVAATPPPGATDVSSRR